MIYADEIVTQIDMNQPWKKIKQQIDANTAAKLRHAERREQERFDSVGLIDKALNLIYKLRKVQLQKTR